MYLINEAEVFGKWAPIIESTTGISDKSKLDWMTKYCHYHELYENQSWSTLPSVNGMGATRFPGDPGSYADFGTQAPGSGDKAHTLLPLAMQVAAQTIGLDLVPVVPMPGPMGVLTYLDAVYAGGKVDGDGKNIPLMIKVDPNDTKLPALSAGVAIGDANDGVTFVYVGNSRLDAKPIFHIKGELTAGKSLVEALEGVTGVTAADTGEGEVQAKIELVKALEDHITGFSGRGLEKGSYNDEPYSREEGESTRDNVMNLRLFNKSVEAKTYQVAAAVTREQVQDLKQFGVDAIAQVETVLTNELTQSLNKNILSYIFRLGERNHEQVIKTQGTNFFVNLGSVDVTVAGTTANPSTNFGTYIESTSLIGVTAKATEVANSASENLHSRQRKILSKILAIANLIAIRGRRGAATFVVTNGQVASALQDVSGFVPAPMANTFNQQGGSLYPIGSVGGLAVYTDPNMAWNDTRFVVGRKGDGSSPGLVFMPYLMADSVQTIAEGTMSPKISIKSRYALVEAGFHPETMYLTSGVYMNPALGSLV